MSADLIGIAVLVAVGFLWLFVNLKIRARFGKVLSYWLMWSSFIIATIAAARFAWEVLS